MASSQEPVATILIVDDEAGMREGCRRALAPHGYAVDAAADIASGLDMIRHRPRDLYLLDLMLPDGSGLDLIAPILERDPNAVCIIITGFGSIERAVEATRRGAYDFISKPFTSDELLVAVNQGLERRRLKAVEAQAQEFVQAKEELERLDQAKSQLMLKVAHELRAPVAAVQSYITLILAGYVAGDELRPTLSRMQQRLQEMLDLIRDLLELARLKQAGDRFAAEAGPQQMADVLKEVCDMLREQADEKKQSFRVEILDRPVVVANREHLKQIWTNLIGNAIKYTPQGGRILVSLATDNGKARGTVEDSGIGIAPEDMQYLFQEFFRTPQAKASGEIGTGLGLSIVKQIVESYGGEIEVTSKPGQGSRFTFVLPLERPAKPNDSSVEPARPRLPRQVTQSTTHARAFLSDEEPLASDRD